MEINRDLLRWILLIAAAPVWWPFLKILWKDFNRALREEGGLLGAPPSAREIDAMRAERAREPETLVSEPWVRPGEVRRPRMTSRSGARRPSGAPAPRAPGFGADRGPRPRA